MTMTDSILLVKETKTCSYVLVINTPRLCGEPGFKSRRDAAEEAEIRCREVVDTLPPGPLNFPVTDYPVKGPQPRKPNLPAAVPVEKATEGVENSKIKGELEGDQKQEKIVNDLLRQTIEALVKKNLGGKSLKAGEPTEIVIELVDDEEQEEVSDKLVNALRAAGYDVRGAEFLDLKDVLKGSDDDINNNNNNKDKDNNQRNDKKRRVRRSTDDIDDYARDEL